MRLLLTLGVIASLSCGCTRYASRNAGVTKEEYEVYSAVLDSLYLGQRRSLVWVSRDIGFDSSLTAACWPSGLVTDAVVAESTMVVSRSGGPFDSLHIDYITSHNEISPGWIDWSGLGASLSGAEYCQSRLGASQFDVSGEVTTIPADTLESIFSGPVSLELRWFSFYRRYPGSLGIVRFSRVGFSSDRSQAVVYWEHTAASLDGVGEYWILRREANQWKLRWRFEVWVS
jgi:hypothetical protein